MCESPKVTLHTKSSISEFRCKVTLDNPETHIYVVSVDSIVDSLNVLQNWGGAENKDTHSIQYRANVSLRWKREEVTS